MFEDGLPTATSKAQNALEKKLLPFYQDLEDANDLLLAAELHKTYLQSGLGKLSPGFAVLDASRTWIAFWLVHSLALLDGTLPDGGVTAEDIADFLRECQHPAGGFGGGPLQLAHLAPTYAAVAAAVTLGGKALDAVDRIAAREFLYRMARPPAQGGGFTVHDGACAEPLRAVVSQP
jgi:protein farnesyltransferase subunit beta